MRAVLLPKGFCFKALTLLFFIICLLLAVWSVIIEPNRIVVNKQTVRLANWPLALNRTRIAVLSDLHVGSLHISLEKLKLIVAQTNELNPDLILLPGDFVVGNEPGGSFVEPEMIADELKNLRARRGVYAVLGNHDWWYDGTRVRRALERAGIRVLENEAAPLQSGDQMLWLVGLSDLWTGSPNVKAALRDVPADASIIAFTHNPDLFTQIPAHVALTIAGHTHGGQVKLPVVGRLVVPSEYGQRYAAGVVNENNHLLFVSTGIGTSILPVRFRVPPEIAVLTINP